MPPVTMIVPYIQYGSKVFTYEYVVCAFGDKHWRKGESVLNADKAAWSQNVFISQIINIILIFISVIVLFLVI